MDANVAYNAARKLSIDVANMGLRLAMLEGEREFISELASQLRPTEWQRTMSHQIVQDPDDLTPPPTLVSVIIAGDQVDALDRFLKALSDLM